MKEQQQKIEQDKAKLEGDKQGCFQRCRSVEREVESVASRITVFKVCTRVSAC